MGIYDREYYRDETSGSGWLTGVTPAVKCLVGINVAVFLANWVMPELRLQNYLAADAADIFERGRVWQLLTAAFFHESGLHIFMNMIVLWMFGRDVESMYGSREFVRMYVTAAVLSTLAWALIDRFGTGSGAIMLGASGAVMAVFVIYALYYPRREILFFFVIPMQIWLLLVLFVGFDLLMLIQQTRAGGRAAGRRMPHTWVVRFTVTCTRPTTCNGRACSRSSGASRGSRSFRPLRERPRAARSVESSRPIGGAPLATARPSGGSGVPEEQLSERVDEILAKIAREGRTSLTDEENRILLEASRRARIKRSEKL